MDVSPHLADRFLLHFSLLQVDGLHSVISVQPGEAHADACLKETLMKPIAKAALVIMVAALCSSRSRPLHARRVAEAATRSPAG